MKPVNDKNVLSRLRSLSMTKISIINAIVVSSLLKSLLMTLLMSGFKEIKLSLYLKFMATGEACIRLLWVQIPTRKANF